MQDAVPSKPRKTPEPRSDDDLDDKALEFLLNQALAGLKRQEDLIESVWRTLPFMGALLGLACTILLANSDAHKFDIRSVEFISDALFLLSFGCLALSFLYLWILVSRKDFRYPSRPSNEVLFANQFKQWLVGNGVKMRDLDQQVTLELRRSALAQLAENYEPNMNHVEGRAKFRSRAIKSGLLGFGLAFASEISMFIIERIEGSIDARCAKAAGKASP